MTSDGAHFLVGGLRIELRGDDSHLASGFARRLAAYSCPAEGDADFVIEAGGPARAPMRPLGRTRIAVEGGEAFVVDLGGRAATFPLDDSLPARVSVEANFDESTFANLVFQPTLRRLLARHRDIAIVHAAAASFGDEAVMVTGWSGAGKTGSLLRLLRAGAQFLGNDWVALGADGVVHPYSTQINLYGRNLDDPDLVGNLPRARRVAMSGQQQLATGLDKLGRRMTRTPFVSRAVGTLGRLVDETSSHKATVTDLPGHPEIGVATPLTSVILLGNFDVAARTDTAEAGRRISIGLRYESAPLDALAFAIAHELGTSPFTAELARREFTIVHEGLDGVSCVTAPASALDEALALARN